MVRNQWRNPVKSQGSQVEKLRNPRAAGENELIKHVVLIT
jgi:hypothetical protein